MGLASLCVLWFLGVSAYTYIPPWMALLTKKIIWAIMNEKAHLFRGD